MCWFSSSPLCWEVNPNLCPPFLDPTLAAAGRLSGNLALAICAKETSDERPCALAAAAVAAAGVALAWVRLFFTLECSDEPCHSCQSCQLGFAEERSSPTSAGRSCQPGLGLERSCQPGLQLPAQCQASLDCHQSPEPDEPLPIHDDCCPQLDIAKTTTDKDNAGAMLKQFSLGPTTWLRL